MDGAEHHHLNKEMTSQGDSLRGLYRLSTENLIHMILGPYSFMLIWKYTADELQAYRVSDN